MAPPVRRRRSLFLFLIACCLLMLASARGTRAGAAPNPAPARSPQIPTATLQDDEFPVRIGVSHNIPLAFFDESGTPQGIFVDILDAIAAAEGWEMAYVFCEWRDCLSSLENGQIDLIAAIAYSAERDAQFDFTGETVFTNWGQVNVHRDSEIQSILDLEGKRVALNPDHVHTTPFLNLIDEFDVQIDIIESENFDQSLQMVHEGTAEAAITNRLQGIVAEHELAIKAAPIVFNPVQIRSAVAEGQNQPLLATIDRHLVAMKADPHSVYYQSLNDWISDFSTPPSQLPRWIRPAGLVALGIIALLVGFTLLLRQQVRARTRQLSRSESQLRAIFENSNDALGVTQAGEHVMVNDAYLKMFGYASQEELVAVPDLLAPQAREEVRGYIQQRTQSGEAPPVYEARGLRQDGSEFDLEARVSTYQVEGKVYTVVIARDITQQKQAKQALQRSERNLVVAQTIARLGSWEWEAATGAVYLSDEMYRILGLDRQAEISMATLEACVHPDDLDRYRNWVASISEESGEDALEIQITRPDGATRIVSLIFEALHDEAGSLMGTVGTVQDVTEKRSRQAHLRQLSRAVEQNPLSVIITNLSGEIEYVNPAFTVATGYEPEEIRGQACAVLQSDQTTPETMRQLWATIRSGGIWHGELLNKKKSGAFFWESVSISPVFDDGGNITHYLSIQEDITDRKETQSRLSQRNRELRLLARATQSISSTLELGQILEIMLQEVRLLLDVTACSAWLLEPETGELVCRHVANPTDGGLLHRRLPPGQGLAGWAVTHNQSLLIPDAGRDERHQQEIDRQLGSPSRSMLVVPLRIQQQVTGVLQAVDGMPDRFTHHDLSLMESLAAVAANAIENAQLHLDLQVQLATLKQTQKRLVQSERLAAVGELIAGIAHELNNPLASVVLYSQLVQRQSLDGDLKSQLEQIVTQAKRASDIVRGLLDFARQRPSERKVVQLNDVLQATLQLLDYELRTHNVAVETNLSPRLPELMADPHQWQQVFVNLINNALQAMYKAYDGGRLRLSSEWKPAPAHRSSATPINSEGTIRITVQDNGPGIPERLQKKVFDPFFTTKETGEGTGLGLAICHGIVADHAGEIWVESEEEQGTTFIIEVPITSLEETAGTPQASPEKATPPLLEGDPLPGRKRILLIDDEESVRSVVFRILTRQGYEVKLAGDGQEGLERLASQTYDLILSDLRMPQMSGPEFYRQVSRRHPAMAKRIVFMTGDTVSPETNRFLNEQQAVCLEKPFEAHTLLTFVRDKLVGTQDAGNNAAPAPQPQKPAIMLVEDNRSIRLSLQAILEQLCGCAVLTAVDGREALETYDQAGNIAVVITDMSMPVMNGEELIHALYERNRRIKIICFSGQSRDAYPSLHLPAAVEWLKKPVDGHELAATVNELLAVRTAGYGK